MFLLLLRPGPSVFGFLSGMLASVSTAALTQVAFASKQLSNQTELLWSALVALLGGIAWFWLSEEVATQREMLALQIKAEGAFGPALQNIGVATKIRLTTALMVAIGCSGAWPFVGG